LEILADEEDDVGIGIPSRLKGGDEGVLRRFLGLERLFDSLRRYLEDLRVF
jgi:hypothetical protein